jgi:hypothetical protein
LNKSILNTGVQDYILKNLNTDILSVSLGKSPFPGVAPKELAQQLSGHQKFKKKVPSWSGRAGLYFPPGLNLEQASSEMTARYKASFLRGDTLVDLTGGLGIDSYFLSQNFKHVHYCETNTSLAEIAAHNFRVLGSENIQVHPGDGFKVLSALCEGGNAPDWIYADPARRGATGGKVIRLREYQPNIPENLNRLMDCGSKILLKTSPLLDLTAGLNELAAVSQIHIVAVANEVRELLWQIEQTQSKQPQIAAVDLYPKETKSFEFVPEEAQKAEARYALPGRYLYEPNAAIMKSGAFSMIGTRYDLAKLHEHTHLYTSDELIPFPGRRFEIIAALPYKPGKLPFKKANISTRNFPQSVAAIRRRTRIEPGGDNYLFFTRLADSSLKVLATRKI